MLHPLIWKNDYQLLSICHHCNIVTVWFDTDLILQTLYHSELPYSLHTVVSIWLIFLWENVGLDSLPLKLMEKNTPIPVLWAYILHWWKSATITKVDKAHPVFTSWSPIPCYIVLVPVWKYDTLKYYLLLLKILFFLAHSQRESILTENHLENHGACSF